jgi:hypothetical protein
MRNKNGRKEALFVMSNLAIIYLTSQMLKTRNQEKLTLKSKLG